MDENRRNPIHPSIHLLQLFLILLSSFLLSLSLSLSLFLVMSFSSIQAPSISLLPNNPSSLGLTNGRLFFNRNKSGFSCRANRNDNENDYLIDAPVSIGDGFSFSGGKYSDGPSRSDEWFRQGQIVKAHPVLASVGKAKDPFFGLTMGVGSQAPGDVFRVLPVLSKSYRAIAFDWLGFGFSDKPQPKYGFDYTLDEYVSSLESLIGELALDKFSLVVQGYFAPVVVKYASNHQDKLKNLILVNPPDPLRASDKTLTSCGPYAMKEEDAMVYRRPYLTSGSSGFALTAISKAMKKELKAYVEDTRKLLSSQTWKVSTTICWGLRDRWLNYDGVEDFCKRLNHELVELPKAGHHVQEDCGEELGQVIARLLAKN